MTETSRVIVSSSFNRIALAIALALAAGIGWIALERRDPLLLVLAVGLLLVGPFVRRVDSEAPTTARTLPRAVGTAAVDPVPEETSIPGLSRQVRDQIVAGNKIGAIKRYREEYGCGLKEAKDAVEAFERQLSVRPVD